jgi:hypothetical protein
MHWGNILFPFFLGVYHIRECLGDQLTTNAIVSVQLLQKTHLFTLITPIRMLFVGEIPSFYTLTHSRKISSAARQLKQKHLLQSHKTYYSSETANHTFPLDC